MEDILYLKERIEISLKAEETLLNELNYLKKLLSDIYYSIENLNDIDSCEKHFFLENTLKKLNSLDDNIYSIQDTLYEILGESKKYIALSSMIIEEDTKRL